MLYTAKKKSFKKHVHPTLQRRLRLFLLLGFVMLVFMFVDLLKGYITVPIALLSIMVGSFVGFISSRIFNLSWSKDGNAVVGRIDTIGWIILALYILFEIARAMFVQEWLPQCATAVTFAFIASALIMRVLSMRGKIISILVHEQMIE